MPYRNSQANSNRQIRDAKDGLRLETAVVTEAQAHETGDNNRHTVKIVPRGQGTEIDAAVAVQARGDTHVPPEDDLVNSEVLILRRRGDIPVVLSTVYSVDSNYEIPAYEPGERRFGHELSDASIFFDKDGNVTIENDDGTTIELIDGDVIINGGTNGVITDITTTKDTDGHVTDISLTRNGNIKV